ncbi:tetratricopeptide repeat protein [Azospirillum sp. sgz302134]
MATIEEALALALGHQLDGRLAEAEVLYGRILDAVPDHADALHLLGLVAAQTGRLERGAELVRAAVAWSPENADYRANFDKILAALGHAAADQYATMAILDPAEPQGALGRANRLLDLGRTEDAARWYRRRLVLRPGHAESWFNLGIALRDSGRLEECSEAFAQAGAANPGLTRAFTERAAVERVLGRTDVAASLLAQAARLRPDLAEVRATLGILFQLAGRLEEAVGHYRAALAVEPGNADRLTNLCVALTALWRVSDAVRAGRRAAVLAPDDAQHRINLGSALQAASMARRDGLEEAADAYRVALALKPDEPDLWMNLGAVRQEQGEPERAVRNYARTLALAPDHAEARFNLGLALLQLGRFERGWVEQEARWKQKRFSSPARNFAQPQWMGEPLEGRTILLHAEQGFGDTIQFVRYAPMVAQRGGRVLLEVPRALMRLCAGLPGVARLIAAGEPLPPFDLHCPLMSLPLAFGTTLSTIPAAPSYLDTDPAEVVRWGARLAGGEGRRVGLVWAGNPSHGNDRNRSLPVEALRPLLAVPGVRFFGVQAGEARRAIPEGVEDLMDGVRDFADTAAILRNLDLLVAVDTATAHLAGALGLPVWLLLPFAPDWRWLLGRDDSPWYPTMRLFRQPERGDWGAVVERVAGELAMLTPRPAPPGA